MATTLQFITNTPVEERGHQQQEQEQQQQRPKPITSAVLVPSSQVQFSAHATAAPGSQVVRLEPPTIHNVHHVGRSVGLFDTETTTVMPIPITLPSIEVRDESTGEFKPVAPGWMTLMAHGENQGVVVHAEDLIRHCRVMKLVLDRAVNSDGSVDHGVLVELSGRQDCGVPTSAPIHVLQYFAAWLEHHRDVPPSRLDPARPLPSIEGAWELFDDLWDYELVKRISPEVRDPSTPWLDITADPLLLLEAADLASTLGCDAFLGAVVHYLDFYAKKELRHVGDAAAVAELWAARDRRRSGMEMADDAPHLPVMTEEGKAAAMKWLARATGRTY